tara:strand:+ start:1676 stop:3700 length:2025 start_codon:yes stop_codon:yes gene_type:complete
MAININSNLGESLTPDTSFITGRVTDVIYDLDHPNSTDMGGFEGIGTIYYESLENSEEGGVAKPLFSFIKSYPLIGEIVIITIQPHYSFRKDSYNKNYSEYYLPNINIWNHPHINAIPNVDLPDPESKTKYTETEEGLVNKPQGRDNEILFGEYFKEQSNIKPLKPFEGDVIIEGRFGNSIRFGSTNVNDEYLLNTWSKDKNDEDNGDPITIIRNGQPDNADNKGWVHIIEDVNNDNSSIVLTSNQQISINPASLNQKSYGANLQKVDPLQVSVTNPTTEDILEPEFEESFEPIEEEDVVIQSPPTQNIEGCTDPSAQNYDEEATLDDGSCTYLEENILVESSTDTLEMGISDQPRIGNSGPVEGNELLGNENNNLGKIIGNNFTLAQLISSGIYSDDIHKEAVYVKFRAYVDRVRGDKEKEYILQDTLGFYLIGTGRKKIIEVKDSDMNIIYTSPATVTNDIATLVNISEKEISGYYSVEDLSPPEGHKLYTPPYLEELNTTGNEISADDLNNYPLVNGGEYTDDNVIENLGFVMSFCIDKIISESPYGQNLKIKSGYRSIELNNKIGGTTTNNEHLKGQAIDFFVDGVNIEQVWEWCYTNLDDYHQLMLAYPELGKDSWIHISYKRKETNKKFTTLASKDENMHIKYGGEKRSPDSYYQDNIKPSTQQTYEL